jgi:DNA-binding NarL/FixJ family response regulator
MALAGGRGGNADGESSDALWAMILEPDEVVRLGLALVVESVACVARVSAVESIEEATRVVTMFGTPGLVVATSRTSAEEFKALASGICHSPLAVLILRDATEATLAQAAEIQADAYVLLKDTSSRSLELLIQSAAKGQLSCPKRLAERLLHRRTQEYLVTPAPFRLNEVETRIVELLAQGMGNKAVGRELGLSENGVKRHVSNILSKTDSPTRTQAVARALQFGVLPSEPLTERLQGLT